MPKVNKKQTVKIKQKDSFFSNLKLGESYTSLIVGVIVVIAATFVVFALVKGNGTSPIKSIDSLSTESDKSIPKTYEVKKGDDLWSISEKIYGSGYNWVDLVKENNLSNPEIIYVGAKLSIPDVEVKNPEKETVMEIVSAKPITGDKYTVQEGDNLWDISVRAYGDGYKWVEVAKANNIVNADLIYSGSVLNLPR
ncbi:MAG: LysM peptidoglycan-binding domain-containing protein [Candidatus Levyibacteriota bacterium]